MRLQSCSMPNFSLWASTTLIKKVFLCLPLYWIEQLHSSSPFLSLHFQLKIFLLHFPPLFSPKNPVPSWGLGVIWADLGTASWRAVENEEPHSESLIRKAPSLAYIIINKPWSLAQQPVGRDGSLNLEFLVAKNQREPKLLPGSAKRFRWLVEKLGIFWLLS